MKCPLCSEDSSKVIADKLRDGDGLVYYCTTCELGFLAEMVKDVKKYYEEEYRKKHNYDLEKSSAEAEELFNAYTQFQQDRLRVMNPFFGKSKKLLEIGCSAGQFLSHAKQLVGEVCGIELDASCASFAMQRLGIKVFEDELVKAGIPESYFDICCAFQVLEHTQKPVEFLKQMKKVLKDDGKIFIEVPNLQDPLLKLWKVPYYQQFYFHKAHNYYFTLNALKKVAAQAGLKIEQHHFTQDYNVVNNLHWHFRNEPQKTCMQGLSKPKFSFDSQYGDFEREFNSVLQQFDASYKDLLARHGLTSNIMIVLTKKQGDEK